MPVELPTMPSPSADALKRLCHWSGGELPPSYLDFVSQHDGAEPEENRLPTSENELVLTRFIPVHEAPVLSEQIEGFPTNVIPFAEDGCGNYLYVEPATGTVRFWDHEVDGEDEEIAADIADLLAKLMPAHAVDGRLTPGQVKHAWIDPDFLADLQKDGGA